MIRIDRFPPSELDKSSVVDFSDQRYWYIRYLTYIKRVDMGVFPAVVEVCFSTDWANRANLSYVPV